MAKMSTTTKIAIPVSILIITAGLLYFGLSRLPVILITNLNKDKKTATVRIGKKTIEYKLDKSTGLEVGKVSVLHTATIVPNPGILDVATIQIKKFGKLVDTKTISW
jgi:hypothetical protein